MKVKSESEVAQFYLTLCDPMDCSLPGSSVHGIFQELPITVQQITFKLISLKQHLFFHNLWIWNLRVA